MADQLCSVLGDRVLLLDMHIVHQILQFATPLSDVSCNPTMQVEHTITQMAHRVGRLGVVQDMLDLQADAARSSN